MVLTTCTWLSIASASLSILFTLSEFMGLASKKYNICSSISESIYNVICRCKYKSTNNIDSVSIKTSNTMKLTQIQNDRK